MVILHFLVGLLFTSSFSFVTVIDMHSKIVKKIHRVHVNLELMHVCTCISNLLLKSALRQYIGEGYTRKIRLIYPLLLDNIKVQQHDMSVYTEETYSKGENSHKIYQTRNSCFKHS